MREQPDNIHSYNLVVQVLELLQVMKEEEKKRIERGEENGE